MTATEFQRARAALGWTLERAAKELQVDKRTVARYKSGEVRIPGPVDRLMSLFLQQHGLGEGADAAAHSE